MIAVQLSATHTFLLPRDDLCVGVREQKVVMYWDISPQIFKYGLLLAETNKCSKYMQAADMRIRKGAGSVLP